MKVKKHLSFKKLRRSFSSLVRKFPDKREAGKIVFSLHDAVMSGFACMFFQDPSLLDFQRRMAKTRDFSNMSSLFNVKKIPDDSQLRELIDNLNSELLRPIFKDFFYRLQRGKQLESYQLLDGAYLATIDGTTYFSSTKIKCEHCLIKNHKNSNTSYSHQVLQVALTHPGMRQVIPLMPEEINN